MKLAFEKVLEKNEVDISDLDRNLQLKIREITQLKNLIESKKRIGQKIGKDTIEKLKELDADLVDLLLDSFAYETDEDGADEPKNHADEQLGILIEKELYNAIKNGLREISMEEMKSLLPNCYDLIWETYEPNEENGLVIANKFSLLENPINSTQFQIQKQ